MKTDRTNILFWTGILTAIWFTWTGMAWTYCTCLLIAYPFGLTSLLIWRKIKIDGKARNKFIPMILLIGLTLSISVLIYLLIFD
jgi:hypothetical protein